MKPGEPFPFRQRVTVVPWGHPSLSAAALLLTETPIPEWVTAYVEAVAPARAHFASLGARFELITTLHRPESELVLTDGFGEVFAHWTESQRTSWPGSEELSEWLVYVASQCPECSPAEPAWRGSER